MKLTPISELLDLIRKYYPATLKAFDNPYVVFTWSSTLTAYDVVNKNSTRLVWDQVEYCHVSDHSRSNALHVKSHYRITSKSYTARVRSEDDYARQTYKYEKLDARHLVSRYMAMRILVHGYPGLTYSESVKR